MDSLVTLSKKLGSSPEAIEEIEKKFNEQAKNFKKATHAQCDSALNELNPATHAFLYAEILGIKSATDPKNLNDFIEQARTLFLDGDANQLKKAIKAVCVISRRLSSSLLLVPDRLFRGVLPLRTLVQKIATGPSHHILTPIHSDFALIALKAKAFDAAAPVIQVPVTQIKPQENALEPLDYLQYFYYSGMIFAALKQWGHAMEAFQMALTIPSTSISAVQVACYKKLILVSLIATGEAPILPPKTTPQILSRHLEALVPQYVELARAYKRSIEDVQKTLDVHADTWKKDHSLGLARQCVESSIRRTIQRLTATYLTLSLTAIAEAAKLPSAAHAHTYITNMIASGEIFAVINARDGMVSFLEDVEDYDTTKMVHILDMKIRACIDISKQLHTHDQQLALKPQYVAKTNVISGAGGPAGRPDSNFAYDEEDADMKMAMQLSLS